MVDVAVIGIDIGKTPSTWLPSMHRVRSSGRKNTAPVDAKHGGDAGMPYRHGSLLRRLSPCTSAPRTRARCSPHRAPVRETVPQSNKNGYLDAEAIAEAVQRPAMRNVPAKSVDQLDLPARQSRSIH